MSLTTNHPAHGGSRRALRKIGRCALVALGTVALMAGGCDRTGDDAPAPETAAETAAQPVVMVGGEASRDLGWVFTGELKSGKVPLANHGDAPLEFGPISSSSSVAGAYLSRTTLQPGEEAYLVYSYRAGQQPGPDLLRIAFATNDPEVPNLIVQMRANVVAGLVTEPARVDVRMRPGERRDVKLTWRSDRWTIDPVVPVFGRPGMRGTTPPSPIDRGVEITATFAVPDDANPGLIETWVGLRMNLGDPRDPEAAPEERTVSIPVVITVPPTNESADQSADGPADRPADDTAAPAAGERDEPAEPANEQPGSTD